MQNASSSPRRRGSFRERAQRLARRAERDTFRATIMPAAWLCGMLGAAVLLGSAAINFSAGGATHELTGIGLGLVALPVVFFLYRVVRGHFRRALNEP